MWKSVQKRDRIIWKSGNPYEAGTDKTFSLDTLPQEYTAYGNDDYRINGLETEQADGSDTANLKYESYEISKGKYRYRAGHSKKAMSMEMDYEYRELDAVHFYGKHNMERQMERTHLGHGNWSVGSIRGTSCHYH